MLYNLKTSKKRSRFQFGRDQVLLLTNRLDTYSIKSVINEPTRDLTLFHQLDDDTEKDFYYVKNLIQVNFRSSSRNSTLDLANFSHSKTTIEGYSVNMEIQVKNMMENDEFIESFKKDFGKINSLNGGIHGFILLTKDKVVKGVGRLIPNTIGLGDGNVNSISKETINFSVLDFEHETLNKLEKSLFAYTYPEADLDKMWKIERHETVAKTLENTAQELADNPNMKRVVINFTKDGYNTNIYQDITKPYITWTVVKNSNTNEVLGVAEVNKNTEQIKGTVPYWKITFKDRWNPFYKQENPGKDIHWYGGPMDFNATFNIVNITDRDWVVKSADTWTHNYTQPTSELTEYENLIKSTSTSQPLKNFIIYSNRFKTTVYANNSKIRIEYDENHKIIKYSQVIYIMTQLNTPTDLLPINITEAVIDYKLLDNGTDTPTFEISNVKSSYVGMLGLDMWKWYSEQTHLEIPNPDPQDPDNPDPDWTPTVPIDGPTLQIMTSLPGMTTDKLSSLLWSFSLTNYATKEETFVLADEDNKITSLNNVLMDYTSDDNKFEFIALGQDNTTDKEQFLEVYIAEADGSFLDVPTTIIKINKEYGNYQIIGKTQSELDYTLTWSGNIDHNQIPDIILTIKGKDGHNDTIITNWEAPVAPTSIDEQITNFLGRYKLDANGDNVTDADGNLVYLATQEEDDTGSPYEFTFDRVKGLTSTIWTNDTDKEKYIATKHQGDYVGLITYHYKTNTFTELGLKTWEYTSSTTNGEGHTVDRFINFETTKGANDGFHIQWETPWV